MHSIPRSWRNRTRSSEQMRGCSSQEKPEKQQTLRDEARGGATCNGCSPPRSRRDCRLPAPNLNSTAYVAGNPSVCSDGKYWFYAAPLTKLVRWRKLLMRYVQPWWCACCDALWPSECFDSTTLEWTIRTEVCRKEEISLAWNYAALFSCVDDHGKESVALPATFDARAHPNCSTG